MSFSLATRVTPVRNVKTRVFTDPTQYDTEINAARGFSPAFDARVAATKAVLKRVPQLAVTEREVIEAQNFWAQSIVDISNSFLTGGDYVLSLIHI